MNHKYLHDLTDLCIAVNAKTKYHVVFHISANSIDGTLYCGVFLNKKDDIFHPVWELYFKDGEDENIKEITARLNRLLKEAEKNG